MITNVPDFIEAYEDKVGDYFFSQEWLDWFGEKKEEMELIGTTIVKDCYGNDREVYELHTVRHKAPYPRLLHGIYYFDVDTLKNVKEFEDD
jgi:hypothetical protein